MEMYFVQLRNNNVLSVNILIMKVGLFHRELWNVTCVEIGQRGAVLASQILMNYYVS